MSKTTRLCLALAAILLVWVSPVAAQTPTLNEINEVARELWCPLCNGVRLDNCDLQACIQMREVIAQRLTAGESKEQIKSYFVEQYGDVVLGVPASGGFNSLVWILPILAAVVALAWLAYFVYMWTRRRPATSTADNNATHDAVEDVYLSRVDEELRKLE